MREEPIYKLHISASAHTVNHQYEGAVDVINPHHGTSSKECPITSVNHNPRPTRDPTPSKRVLPPRAGQRITSKIAPRNDFGQLSAAG